MQWNAKVYATILSLLIAFSTGSALAITKHACDDLAAHPDDPQKIGPGVPDGSLNAAAAIDACQQAVEQFPGESRFHFQLARALLAQKRFREARPLLDTAIKDGESPAAASYLADLLSGAIPSGTKPDPARALELYRIAVQGGFQPAIEGVRRIEPAPAGPSPSASTASTALPATVSPVAPVAQRPRSAIEECDRLAAHPADPEAFATGVPDDTLQADQVIAACQTAVQQDRNSPRLAFQAGRGYLAAGRYEEAVESLLVAAKQGHGGALGYLADLYLDGAPGIEADPVTARALYARAAASGFEPARRVLSEFEDYTEQAAAADSEERALATQASSAPTSGKAAAPAAGGKYITPEIVENVLKGDYDAVSVNEFYAKVYLVKMAENISGTCNAHFTKRDILQLQANAASKSTDMSAGGGIAAAYGIFQNLARAIQNPQAHVETQARASIDQEMLPEEAMKDTFTLMARHPCNSPGLTQFSKNLVAFINNEGAPRTSADDLLAICRRSSGLTRPADATNFCTCFLGAASRAPLSRRDRKGLANPNEFKATVSRLMGEDRQRFGMCAQ